MAAAPEQRTAARKRILVVDDSAVVRKIASRMVKALGFDTAQAENGRIALEMCARDMPDAVLLDWDMPVMDGLSFLLALREVAGGDRPKVVFCTAQNEVAQIVRAMEAGADEYVMKPFDKDILAAKFEEVGLLAFAP